VNSTVVLYLLQDGIANGAVYALLSLATVLIFSVTRIIFLPQGEFVSFAALTFVFLQEGHLPGTVPLLGILIIAAITVEVVNGLRTRNPRAALRDIVRLCALPSLVVATSVLIAGSKLPLLVHALLAIAIVSANGPLLYRLVYEPIADASILVLLIVSVALHFVLVGLGLYLFGPAGVRSAPIVAANFSIGAVPIPGQTLVILAVTIVLIAILFIASRHTYYGKAMQAVAINRTGARLMGISSSMAGRASFLLAAMIGAISGVLIAPVVTIFYDTGFLLGLKGFIGAIVGGFGSYPAAALGSIAVGLLESYSSFFASAFKDAIVFALIIPALAIRSLMSQRVDEEEEKADDLDAANDDPALETRRTLIRRSITTAFVLAVAAAPLILSEYQIVLLDYVGLAAIVVLGLVLLTGIAGLTSFGQAAFVGLGAYVTGYLTAANGLSPWLTLPLVIAVTLALSFVASAVTVRLSGHYLPLCTLAIGLSAYFLFGSLQITGGQSGMSGIPSLGLLGFDLRSPKAFYVLVWGVVLISLLGLRNLLDSRPGRAIRALKHGVGMAEAMGVDTHKAKMTSFILACILAGLSGWLYAHFQRFLNPTPFSLNQGIEYLFMAVIGGVGTLGGAIAGSGLVVLLKEWLQDILPRLLGSAGNFEMVVFGIITIIMLQHAPGGLWPAAARLMNSRGARARVPKSAQDAHLESALPARPQPPRGQILLSVNGVHKSFDALVANRDVSFTVEAGAIVALIGPNGAGKTTMFNLISNVLSPSAGSIVFLGRSTGGRPTRALVRDGMARTFQHVKIIPDMSVLENAALGAHGRGRMGIAAAGLRLDRIEERRLLAEAHRQLGRVGLAHLADRSAGSLALGQQRILEIARALCTDPCLLLLDEPAAGLRFKEKEALATLLGQLKSEGMAVLLVEHDMDFVMTLADRVIVMNFGEKLTEGTPAEVQRNPAVIDAYLGGAA
jgi:ABC-type branched-subunit amino acid transport system ATPase component/ABC-type branched-subunit amino acid transport system permease subunit